MRRIVLIVVLSLFIIPLTAFQGVINRDRTEPSTWFYAWEPEGIFAFNLEGEIRPLAGDLDPADPIFRLDGETMLALLDDADTDQLQFYRLTPDGAEPIGPPLEETLILREYSAPWAIFYPIRPLQGVTQVLLLDVETADWEFLDVPPEFVANPCCTFLDSATMRYWHAAPLPGSDSPRDAIYELRDRNLTTRTEETLFSVISDGEPYDYSGFIGNGDGTLWVERRADRSGEDIVLEFNLLDSDGNRELLSVERGSAYSFYNNDLLFMDATCEGDCVLIRSSPDGEELARYPYPDDAFSMNVIAEWDNKLAFGGSEVFYLQPDTLPAPLFSVGRTNDFFTLEPASPDGRYVFTTQRAIDTEELLLIGILDMDTGDIVYTYPLSTDEDTRNYFNGNVQGDYMVIRNFGIDQGFAVFNWRTGDSYDFHEYERLVAEPVDDTRFITSGRRAETAGIYVLDLETGEETLLLEGRYRVLPGLPLR